MLQPWGKGLLGTTLRYPYEVRDEKAYFDGIAEIQIPKDMLALAEHILETKTANFDASEFHDRYEEAIVAMLNEKKAGIPVPKCPSSDDLRQFGCFRKGGSGSSVVEIKRHAGDAANDDLRWSGV